MQTATGLFVTFLDDSDGTGALPPVGPLDDLVVRHRTIMAERLTVAHADELGADVARWLEAELEFQRATGQEPGGVRRRILRVAAPQGVFLRFGSLGDPRESAALPELGPFALVHVRPRSIEADGVTLAIRDVSELASWQLTAAVAPDAPGLRRPDVAFRTVGTSFHPEVVRAPVVEPDTPVAPSAFEPTLPTPTFPAEEPPAPTDRNLELMRRIEREREDDMIRTRAELVERARLGVEAAGVEERPASWSLRYRLVGSPTADAPTAATSEGAARVKLDWRTLLWRGRFAIIALLALGYLVVGVGSIRTGFTSVGQPRTVGIGDRVSVPGWDYTVNSANTLQVAGTVVPQGSWLVVRVTATNRGQSGAGAVPSSFEVVDAAGTRYAPESLQSDVYSVSGRYAWPTTFPPGRAVTLPLVFDVPSGASGVRLVIQGAPVRVRLD